jgi:mannose-1-phosphate guanylyltransferase
MQEKFAVIMAGGIGSRFWPESTEENPKQFLDLTGTGKSLLRQTYERINKTVPRENILVVSNRKYKKKIQEQIPEIPPENILAEPVMRNTAPAVLYAANRIHSKSENAAFVILPSDHYIENEKQFINDIDKSLHFASENDVLITLGIQPDSPHTGYGYIRFDKTAGADFKPVLQFVEKPDPETAKKYLKSGDYLWNAGIFVWRTDVIRDAFRKHLHGMFSLMEKVDYGPEKEQEQIEKVFPGLENISVDYGIMEKAENVRVLPVSFGWNDLGSWDAIHKQLAGKPSDNIALNSILHTKNARGNLVKTDGKKVILSGLNDFLIVESGDVLMIIPRSEAQEVKKWRERLK